MLSMMLLFNNKEQFLCLFSPCLLTFVGGKKEKEKIKENKKHLLLPADRIKRLENAAEVGLISVIFSGPQSSRLSQCGT